MSSRTSAPTTLVLDFNGDIQYDWGSPGNTITSPAYDTDGDPLTYSDTELANIREMWQIVAEDYAPYNINVTTVDTGDLTDYVTMKIVVGGDGAWTGGGYGGICGISAFTNAGTRNVGFVFCQGQDGWAGNTISHESGHGFSLWHQQQWDPATNTLQAEYDFGPIMGGGNSYDFTRWSNGTGFGSTWGNAFTHQNDQALLGINNFNTSTGAGFTFASDRAGNLKEAAAVLMTNGSTVSQQGLVNTETDQDYYRFTTSGGSVSFTFNPAFATQASPYKDANVTPTLELRDASGNLVTSVTGASMTATLNASSLAAGDYFLVVKGGGTYGETGSYKITGSVPGAVNTVTWDGDTSTAGMQEGAGTWNTTDTNRWYNGSSYQTWSNASPVNAVFGQDAVNSSTAYTVTLGSGITAKSVTFNEGGAYTITGNTLTLAANGQIINNYKGAIASNITLSGAGLISNNWGQLGSDLFSISGAINNGGYLLTVGGAKNTTISGVISGNGGLNKVEGGILTLSNTNTYSGTTTIGGGVLRATQGTGLPSSNLVLSGGALETSGSFTRSLGSGANQVQFSTGATPAGFSARGGALTVNVNNNGSTLTWGAANFNPTGGLVLNADSADSALTLSNGLDLAGAVRTFYVNANTATISGAVSGSAGSGITKLGAGSLVLSQGTSTTGAVTVTSGTLDTNNHDLTASSVSMGGDALGTSSTLNLGSGTLYLTGNFSYSAWANNGATFTAGGINLSAGDHTFTIEPGPTFILTPGAISGSGNLLFNSWGTIALGGNTYTGTTTLTHTTITMNDANAFGTTGAGTTLDGAIVQALKSTAENFTVIGDSTLGNWGGNPNLSGTITVNSGKTLTLSTGGGNPMTFSGVLAGAGNFTLSHNPTWPAITFGGTSANTLSGTTTVTGGIILNKPANVDAIAGNVTIGQDARGYLLLNANEQIANTSVLTFIGSGDARAGALQLNGCAETVAGIVSAAGEGIIENTHATNAGTLAINGSGTYTYGGIIRDGSAGILNLMVNGSGTQVLSGANTYTGTTTVSSGTLRISGGSAIPDASSVTVSSGATLDVNGSTETIGAITCTAGTVAMNNGTLSTTGGSLGGLTGSGTVNKTGAGELDLYDNTNFSGALNLTGTVIPYTITSPFGNATGATTLTNAFIYTVDTAENFTIASNSTMANGGPVSLTGTTTVNPGAILTLSTGGGNYLGLNGVLAGSGNIELWHNPSWPAMSVGGNSANTNTGSFTLQNGGMILAKPAGTTAIAGNLTIGTADLAWVLLNASNQIADTSVVTLAGSGEARAGRLQLNTFSETLGGLVSNGAGEGIVENNGATASVLTLNNAVGASNVFSGVVRDGSTGTLAVTKSGSGTQVLSGSDTYTGATTISAGALRANSGTGLPTNSNLALAGGVLEGSGALTFSRALGTGNNQVRWTGNGGFAANGGKLTVTLSGAPNPLVWGSTANFVAAGSSLVFGSSTADSETEFTHAINLNSAVRTVRVDDNAGSAGDFAKLSGVLSSTGGLTKTGAGQLNLTGNNTFTGVLTVADGTLSVGTFNATNAAGPLGQCTSATVLGSSGTTGRLQYTGGTASSTRTFTMATSGTGGLDVTSAGTTLTDSGVIGGSGGLTKFGAGTLTLSGSNTFTGVLTVAQGTLSTATMNATNANGPLGRSTNPTVLGSSGTTGMLQYTGATTSSTRTWTMATGGTGGFDISTAGTTLTLSGVINGSGGLTKAGAGSVILSGNNTYSGTTTVSAGVLQAGRATNSFGTGPASVSGGATLRLNGYSTTVSSLTGGGTVHNNHASTAVTFTLNGSDTASFSGVIANGAAATLGLTRSGTGRQTLTGVNTYTGPTTISGGTLVLGGSGSINSTSGITLSGGTLLQNSSTALNRTVTFTSGTIGGTGTFTGNMSPGAVHIAPGDGGAGTFGITGALTMASTSVLDFDLSTVGGSNDLLTMTGALTLDGTINVTAPGGILGGGTYTLISGFTSLTNNTLNFGTMPGGHGYTITTDASHVYLNAAPEPATLCLLALGGLAMLRRRRK